MESDLTLQDIGEFNYIENHLKPILSDVSQGSSFGSDCSVFESSPGLNKQVYSTDVGPKPISWKLAGGENDYRTFGYYSVLVNVSDLATEGAMPMGFLNSTEAPASFSVEFLNEFFRGVKEGLVEYNLTNLGGNLREAASFSTHGTVVGCLATQHKAIGRSGACEGDAVVMIGAPGCMISSFLKAKRLGSISNLNHDEIGYILRPKAKVREMQILRQSDIEITAASDNSDGIIGSLKNIADGSNVRFRLFLDESMLTDSILREAKSHNINPWNLFFFWGDWQMILTISKSSIPKLLYLLPHNDISILGEVISSVDSKNSAFAQVEIGGELKNLELIRNENFVDRSFNRDQSDHLDYFLNSPLFY